MAQKWIDKIDKNNEEYDIYREGFEIGTNESGNYTLSLSNTPPIYNITDQVPYNFRPSGGDLNIGKKELDELVGGTVAWNQLASLDISSWGSSYVSASVSGTKFTITSSVSSRAVKKISKEILANHVYLFGGSVKTDGQTSSARFGIINSAGSNIQVIIAYNANYVRGYMMYKSEEPMLFAMRLPTSASQGQFAVFKDIQLFDVTQKFGATIADYIYSIEQATAGAGVAYFRNLFPKPYYPYNPAELISVQTSAHKIVGFNQFDISSKTNNSLIVWATGNIVTENMSIVSDYIRIVPRAKYYCNYKAQWCCYDSNYTYLGAIDPSGTLVFSAGVETNSVTLPADYSIVFIRLGIRTGSNNNEDMTAKTDINLNLSYNGSNDGKYEPYTEHTYNLPNAKLRGIFKLDSNNKLYCDGDIEKSDGTIIRYYATRSYQSGDESLENAITDGTNTVYKLETPIIEKTNFFTNPQTVYNQGTEEYIDNREVAIPVGHNTKYDEPWEEIKN